MKRVNKDSVVNISLLLIGVVGLAFSIISNSNKNEVNSEYKKQEKVDKEQFAMYIEDDNGNYVEYESNVFPSGYILNLDKSQCLDINNNIVEGVLSNVDNSITVTSNKTVFCYLYFDSSLATIIMNLTGQTVGDGTVINANGYRYSGSNPDNYITFNNEPWRIIGIVDGYVKIIRNDSLGYFSWDYKTTGVGSSITDHGSNDWTDSQLMMMLNPSEYLKEGYTISNNMVYDPSGNLVYRNMGSYYNRTSGYRPSRMTVGATSYSGTSVDFSSTGLNLTAINMVQENVWYIASPVGGDFTPHEFSPDEFYKYERNGENTYGENSITWKGKVGLMYISDYFYANNNLYSNPDTYDFSDGCVDNWLCVLDGEDYEWTLAQHFSFADAVIDVDFEGTAGFSAPFYTYVENAVRPVLYLKSGIKVTGEGTIDSKYQIIS